jgi:hypothetical protein
VHAEREHQPRDQPAAGLATGEFLLFMDRTTSWP